MLSLGLMNCSSQTGEEKSAIDSITMDGQTIEAAGRPVGASPTEGPKPIAKAPTEGPKPLAKISDGSDAIEEVDTEGPKPLAENDTEGPKPIQDSEKFEEVDTEGPKPLAEKEDSKKEDLSASPKVADESDTEGPKPLAKEVVFKGTAPKGVEGFIEVVVNAKEGYKFEIQKDGSFVIHLKVAADDVIDVIIGDQVETFMIKADEKSGEYSVERFKF